MFVLRSICFQALFHVCAQIHMFLGSFPCLCLDLYVFAQIYMFVSRSTCLCLDLCVYVLRAMLVCLDLCWLLCHVLLQPFCLLISIFLTFWPFQWGVDLDPVVQTYIRTLRPISKGLDHFLYAYPCLLAYFYALYPCQPHQIQALLYVLCALRGFVRRWLDPSLLGFVWM